MTARTIMPVLPQEDPKQLEELTQDWIRDIQPQNAVEHELVNQAARLALAIERGERIETAHLARRVRKAAQIQTQKLGARRRKEVREHGRRLLYVAAPEEVKVSRMPHWADDPELLVSQLEESAEGCRWLLQRWAEYRNLLDRKTIWNIPVLLRFIRLQGKNVVESIYDPALNSIFLAWDVVVPKYAGAAWHLFQEVKPRTDPAFNHRLAWCEIAPRPGNADEAWALLYGIVDQHVDRLKELLAANEAIEAEEDPDWADRAALDCSPAFERHRRCQSARTRELLRTLDTLRKMRKEEFGTENGKAGMADGKCQMASDECQGVAGGCEEEQSNEPMTKGSSGPEVGYDSNRGLDDATTDTIAMSSHEIVHAAEQPGEGDVAGRCLRETKAESPKSKSSPGQRLRESKIENPESKISTTFQKAPNKANLEEKQSPDAQGFTSEKAGAEGQKQSQSSRGEASPEPRSRVGWLGRVAGGRWHGNSSP